MILRCTVRMLSFLNLAPRNLEHVAPSDEDWYANLFWHERRKIVLLTHAGTLYSAIIPDVRKRDLADIQAFVREALATQLRIDGLPGDVFGELATPPFIVNKTADRKVVACMNQIAIEFGAIVGRDGLTKTDVASLTSDLNGFLRRGPNYVVPIELVRERAIRASSRQMVANHRPALEVLARHDRTPEGHRAAMDELARQVVEEDREALDILAAHDADDGSE